MAFILFGILGIETGASTLYWVLFWFWLAVKVIITICDNINS